MWPKVACCLGAVETLRQVLPLRAVAKPSAKAGPLKHPRNALLGHRRASLSTAVSRTIWKLSAVYGYLCYVGLANLQGIYCLECSMILKLGHF